MHINPFFALFAVSEFFVCVLIQEFVLQPDGSVTQVQSHNVQNLVLDEQRAGQILTLAQVGFTFK